MRNYDPSEPKRRASRFHVQAMKILITDDHAANRKVLRAQLEGEGLGVLEAGDGVEALAILERQAVDAIISDILMPKMDGYRLCYELRNSPKFHQMPFILYTSTYTAAGDRELARNVAADKYLVKPASIASLLSAINEATEQSKLRRTEAALSSPNTLVMEEYNARLVSKLEEKHAELQRALDNLQRAHERILKLNQSLENGVQQRTRELASLNEELCKRNREIQNFYHTLAHELKTPLTSAREFISIVKDGLAGPANQTQAQYLGYALESCDHLTVCIDDLLDATRLDTGKLAVALKRGLLGEVVKRVVAGLKGEASARKINLNYHIQPGLPLAIFDETRIAQVTANLVANALKFTPEGGHISLKVSAPAERPEHLQVDVQDDGPGVPPDEQELIFDRLHQVKHGDAATEKGLGLGLYICRELVLLHGGQIWVKSAPGQGSTFSFAIPIRADANHGGVLVVDDDAEIRDAIRQVLERGGFEVRVAGDGEEALELMQQSLPELVVLDLEMPRMDGATTLKSIRQRWGGLPVVVHTAFPSGDLMNRALEASPFTALAKPCPADKLLETVRRTRKGSATEFWKRTRPAPNKVETPRPCTP